MCIFQGFLTTHRGKALTLFETCENLRNTHWLVGPNHPHNSWKTSARNHFRSGKMVIQWIHSGQMEECFTNLDFPELFGDFHFSVTKIGGPGWVFGRVGGSWMLLDAYVAARDPRLTSSTRIFGTKSWEAHHLAHPSEGIVVVDPKGLEWLCIHIWKPSI